MLASRVLVVEDEPAISHAIAYALRRDGFDVAEDGDAGHLLDAIDQELPCDVVILDLGLPRVDGLEVLRRVRSSHSVPIIIVSARVSEADRILGLELGADDYLTKPFSIGELASRVRAVLRRCELEAERGSRVIDVGDLRIDLARHRVAIDGRTIYLTASQFKLLALLAETPNAVVRREAIMKRLWDSDYVGPEHVCDVHISNLRHKVERDPANPQRIITIRGVGYELLPI